MAGGMQTEDDFATGRFFDTQSLSANGDAAVGANLNRGAHAPDVGPPRAEGDGTHDRTIFSLGLIPGSLWSLAQFAMDFVGIAVRPQGVDVRIGDVDFID